MKKADGKGTSSIDHRRGARAALPPSFLSLFLLALSVAFLSACAPLQPRSATVAWERPSECRDFLERLDSEIDRSGLTEASAVRVEGFPYLRTNRFLAALKDRVEREEELDQWVELMRQQDMEAREKELSRLPGAFAGATEGSPSALMDRIGVCSQKLLEHDRRQPAFAQTLRARVHVPDEYSSLLQAAGFHVITGGPFKSATERVQRRFRAIFHKNMEGLPVTGTLTAFAPPMEPVLTPADTQSILRSASRNPLSIPLPGGDDLQRLFAAFAPLYIQDVAASYDRPGAVSRRNGRIEADSSQPSVYTYTSHALVEGRPVLQLNYVHWYPARAGENAPRLERGRLDGLTVRISLDSATGRPFMVEAMNNCGCYHMLIPAWDKVRSVKTNPHGQDPFVPQWLPFFDPGERAVFRINSGWHQVERVFSASSPSAQSTVTYRLADYASLEGAPAGAGRTGSRERLFDSHGLVEGSERIERFILFSSGIPSIGTMRQRGHHAIDLTGRAHFDDPLLFEKSFVMTE